MEPATDHVSPIRKTIQMIIRSLKMSIFGSVLGGRINWISREKALLGVIKIATNDEYIKEVLAAFKAPEDDLRELYALLIKAGASQWVNNSFVAAVGITNPIVVYAYLRAKNRNEISKSFALNLAFACIEYIEQKFDVKVLLKTLEVPEKVTLKPIA
jgi:hypothetical protein